jgi:PEP-CTERM motif
MPHSIRRLIAPVLLTLPVAASAVVHADEASFVAAAGAAKIALPGSLAPTSGFSATGFSFLSDPDQTFVIDTPTYGQAIAGEDNLLFNGHESHTVLSAQPLYAFGFKVFQPGNAAPVPPSQVACYFPCDAGTITVSLSLGAAPVTGFSFTPAFDTVEFHGWAGSMAFDTIRISDDSGSIDDEYFAIYRYSLQPVPEPATAALMLGGAGLLAAMRRRRSMRA